MTNYLFIHSSMNQVLTSDHQRRADRVLRCEWLLHFTSRCILSMGVHPAMAGQGNQAPGREELLLPHICVPSCIGEREDSHC